MEVNSLKEVLQVFTSPPTTTPLVSFLSPFQDHWDLVRITRVRVTGSDWDGTDP